MAKGIIKFAHMSSSLGKYIIITGILVIMIGVIIHFSGYKSNFLGKLPGDINIRRDNFSFHFPIVTCILISVTITIIVKIVQYFSR